MPVWYAGDRGRQTRCHIASCILREEKPDRQCVSDCTFFTVKPGQQCLDLTIIRLSDKNEKERDVSSFIPCTGTAKVSCPHEKQGVMKTK